MRPVTLPSTERTKALATSSSVTGTIPAKASWKCGEFASTFGLTALMRMPRGSSGAAETTKDSTAPRSEERRVGKERGGQGDGAEQIKEAGMKAGEGDREVEAGCARVYLASRGRHTRSKRDWSADVCSSDLLLVGHRDHPGEGVMEVRGVREHIRADRVDADAPRQFGRGGDDEGFDGA